MNNYDVFDKYKCNDNLYNNYIIDINRFNYISNRINSIYNKLNDKIKIYTSCEEVEFLGFRFSINKRDRIIMKITNKTKKRFNNIKVKKKMLKNELINFDDYRNIRDSYLGHLSHGNCNGLVYNTINIF